MRGEHVKDLTDSGFRELQEVAVYEWPLPEWRDVAGSKGKPWDFAKGLCDLAWIYWQYLRPRALMQGPKAPLD